MDRRDGFPDALAPEARAALPVPRQAGAHQMVRTASDALDGARPAATAGAVRPESAGAGAGKLAGQALDDPAQDASSLLFARWAEPASVGVPCKQGAVPSAEQSFAATEWLARSASAALQPQAVRAV